MTRVIWARSLGSLMDLYTPDLESFSESVSPQTILDLLVNESPTITYISYTGQTQLKLLYAEKLKEYTFGGTLKEELNELLRPLEIQWTIHNNELVLAGDLDKSILYEGDILFEVSIDSGLLTRPKIDWVGIEFDHLLTPQLYPTGIINLIPQTVERDFGNELYVPQPDIEMRISGNFRVMEAKHSGDTRGDTWKTSVKAYSKV